jgi:hypothetical protein
MSHPTVNISLIMEYPRSLNMFVRAIHPEDVKRQDLDRDIPEYSRTQWTISGGLLPQQGLLARWRPDTTDVVPASWPAMSEPAARAGDGAVALRQGEEPPQ